MLCNDSSLRNSIIVLPISSVSSGSKNNPALARAGDNNLTSILKFEARSLVKYQGIAEFGVELDQRRKQFSCKATIAAVVVPTRSIDADVDVSLADASFFPVKALLRADGL